MVEKYVHSDCEETFRLVMEEEPSFGRTVSKRQPRKLYDSKLTIDGQDILYFVTQDPDFLDFIVVPGVIINYKVRDNGHGLLESDVEPIADEGLKAKVEMALKDIKRKGPINFWTVKSEVLDQKL